MPGNKKPGELSSLRVEVPSAAKQPDTNLTALVEADQPQAKRYLVGSLTGVTDWLDGCPYAASIVGFAQTLDAWVIIQIRCKRWGCRHCGERKMAYYAHKVRDAKPTKFITLTVASAMWDSPRAAYDGTRQAITRLAIKLRRRYGEFEYFRVLETTKKGWPHYHLIARCDYIPQPDLSKMWRELTGAHIVDIRRPKGAKNIFSYVMKYLGKQTHVPWTNRRLAWSRHFFVKKDFAKGPGLDLIGQEFRSQNPASILCWDYGETIVESYSRDCWFLRGRPHRGSKEFECQNKKPNPQKSPER